MKIQYDILNKRRDISPLRVGNGSTVIIAIIGITDPGNDPTAEFRKASVATHYGASMIGDVSTEGDIASFHRQLIESIPLPLNTVPLYEVFHHAVQMGTWGTPLTKSLILDTIYQQAERGVDCMTLHAAFSLEESDRIEASRRRIRIQSRGGGLLHHYMQTTRRQNPLLEFYDDILSIVSDYNITVSLGSSLRPGSVVDPLDEFLASEISAQSELGRRASTRNVNCMVEGISHLRFDLIPTYVRWMKARCHGLPLRLLGPLGTERGLGYDHITAAISAAPAIIAGADLLTAVTRAEHIGLPDEEELREALVALRIAKDLATQSDKTEIENTTFLCGLNYHMHRSEDFIDLERVRELKLKKGGSLKACTMCNSSCYMVTSVVTEDLEP
jgi:phosphomethylpyrimidine synthase